ncbi:maleylpyruvate isomerase family mycothiol-dependent enzyme [Cryptosporangium aurantiacum]|uniref:TIGR03083 family protein n=1 Tax=Cryptosporangium aurantiacum TaxID=134849 RepID=A0A1M7RDH4_9ACTN|nr:maleylpyruvate isomerase family mycothiol-dependent enzyme [Cryptosporangium aurantiacum]SHN44266.1 TIGR03083 family protein [Cryptosporangium aurantiacum]
MNWSRIGPPIDVRPLFAVERAELLAVLGTLDEEQWLAPTVCPGWSVHDLVAHVVHDYMRRLSGGRDGWSAGWIPVPDGDIAPVLNRANDEFAAALRGISPRVLIGLVAGLGPQLDDYWATRDLDAPGISVSWAAPDVPAPAWLDIAREYTEFWVHQQQIRDAVGRPGADSRQLTYPVVDAFLRALPRALADADGTSVTVAVSAPVDDAWTARRGPDGWTLARGECDAPDARVKVGPRTLWRVATRGIEPDEALENAKLEGDHELARAALTLVSIVR